MNNLRKAAQDIIEDVDSPYIPDEIRMVDVNCIEALRKALQAEPLYTEAQMRQLGEACAVACEDVGKWPSLQPRHCAESIRELIKELL